MLPSESYQHIHILWDTLADSNIAEIDVVNQNFMANLCAMVNAQNAIWFGAVCLGDTDSQDPIKGWRVPLFRYLHAVPQVDAVTREEVKRINKDDMVDATTIAHAAGAGRFRANRLCDLVPEAWFDSSFYKYQYLSVGNHDALYVAFPVNEDAESWFGFFREIGTQHFTEVDRDLMAYALRGIKWYHRQLMLSHGLLIASKPLTPAERRVLHLLLTKAPEKEIGRQLGLTSRSTHQYVVTLYRKFGVNSRSALMSLWLGTS
jgi:DNA-binding CsgD family transcriptional regulator